AAQPPSSLDGDLDESIIPPANTPTPEVSTPVASAAVSTPQPPEESVPPIADTVPESPDEGDDGRNWATLVGPALAVVIAGLGGWWFLSRSPAMDTRRLFNSLVRWGQAGGIRGDSTVTPREYARSVGRRYPGVAHEANDIVDLYEQHRYGGRSPEASRLTQAAGAIGHLRREVIRGILRLRR
ncbi:MAG TPA: DUF4129 domain-containing protein, partial [Thermomicrobiales bacterium]|nr:DUF4129 domain-containing protein [Thermomicrobiales bacterium]